MGCSFYATIIQLPQRLQQVNQQSPTMSGVSLLPVLLPSAAFSAIAGGIYSKFPRTTPLLLAIGGVLQSVAMGLLSLLPFNDAVPTEQYGFEAIAGVGFGLMLPSFMIMARLQVSEKDYGAFCVRCVPLHFANQIDPSNCNGVGEYISDVGWLRLDCTRQRNHERRTAPESQFLNFKAAEDS